MNLAQQVRVRDPLAETRLPLGHRRIGKTLGIKRADGDGDPAGGRFRWLSFAFVVLGVVGLGRTSDRFTNEDHNGWLVYVDDT